MGTTWAEGGDAQEGEHRIWALAGGGEGGVGRTGLGNWEALGREGWAGQGRILAGR